MRKGFTLIECMVAGAILVLVTTAFMRALSVINRVEHENAQYMEADAIVWDAIALNFNTNYAALKSEYWGKDRWEVRRFDTTNLQFAATLSVAFDGSGISAWLEWNGQTLSNRVTRSAYDRWKEDEL